MRCKCKFNDRKCNLNQKWNNNKDCCECFWNPALYSCENGKYLSSIIEHYL